MRIINKVLALLFILIFAVSTFAYADPLDELQRQMQDKQKEIKQTQQSIKEVKKEKSAVAKQIESLDNKLQQAESELDTVETQITNLESQISVTKRDLERASQDANDHEKLLKKRIRVMYETGSVGYLSVLLESTSFGDFISRIDFVKRIISYDSNLLKGIQTKRDNIAKQKLQLQSEMNEKEKLKQQLGDTKEQVEEAKDNKAKAMNELAKDIKELERLEDKLLEDAEEIGKEIVKLQSKASYQNGNTYWPVPSSHRITSYYGYRIHPIYKKKKLHTGIDIGAASGSNVVAFNSGTVIYSAYYGGYGNTVIIDHGGQISTLYAHNSKLLVKVGDKVERGQVISKVGSTGTSTGPHLHFEVRVNGKHTDPMKYLK